LDQIEIITNNKKRPFCYATTRPFGRSSEAGIGHNPNFSLQQFSLHPQKQGCGVGAGVVRSRRFLSVLVESHS